MPFTTALRLRFGDCDMTGIAYHPAYLSLLVDVKDAMFAAAGVPWAVLMGERRISTPVVTMSLEFKRPAFYGDTLDFSMRVAAIGRASLDLNTVVRVRGEVAWTARERLVATSLADHRPTPWPDDVRAGLARFMADEA